MVLFISTTVNHQDATPIIQHLQLKMDALRLGGLILVRGDVDATVPLRSWEDVLSNGRDLSPLALVEAENSVHCDDVVNLQFTSGTTGDPKAAMLCHL